MFYDPENAIAHQKLLEKERKERLRNSNISGDNKLDRSGVSAGGLDSTAEDKYHPLAPE